MGGFGYVVVPQAYVQEPIDLSDLETLFTDNWDIKVGGEIPQPTFAQSDQPRFDPSDSAVSYVNIMVEELVEEQLGFPYQHVTRRLPVVLDIWTRRESVAAGGTGRQLLHDTKQEIRRIIYANMHSLSNWQLMRYKGFREVYEDSGAIRFHGQVRLVLEQDGIAAPTELIDDDEFTRSDGAIGAEWTAGAGTWEVVSNQAALQSATANAHTRFTGSTLKASVRLEVLVVTAASMEAGLLFRWTDTSNYWTARLVESGGVRYLRLVRTTAGTPVTLAEVRASSSADVNWADGDTVEISVDLYGSLIEVQFNGATVVSRVDTGFQTLAAHGIFSNSDQVSRFDSWRVYESGGSKS